MNDDGMATGRARLLTGSSLVDILVLEACINYYDQ